MIWLNQNYNIIKNQYKFLKIYIKEWGKNYFSWLKNLINWLFRLAKPTPNPVTSPRLRTGIIKFDYDASDTNELSVLAKEVRKY